VELHLKCSFISLGGGGGGSSMNSDVLCSTKHCGSDACLLTVAGVHEVML
jgi:hypothetical protein